MDAILITGPTASGKSALAIELAEKHGGEVINADSMQVYDTLRVLTARPAEEDMAGMPHHLYGSVPAAEAYSTGGWLRDVAPVLARLRERGRLPVFVGGTGLYFKALTGGLSEMPTIPPEIRMSLRQRLAEEGPEALHSDLLDCDPKAATMLRPSDGQRVLRALEVWETTGRSIVDFQQDPGPVMIDPDKAMKIVVMPDRTVLRERIDRRFARMLEDGAVAEVEALMALRLPAEMPVMKAIGVPQIAAMLQGQMTREDVIARGAAATRQYAKRQMTWFRNQLDDSWERRG